MIGSTLYSDAVGLALSDKLAEMTDGGCTPDWCDSQHVDELVAAALSVDLPPIDMVLYCPRCCHQHIDKPEIPELDRAGLPVDPATEWTNSPHRSHLCHSCGFVWRPADVATNGVAAVKTKGMNDSALLPPMPPRRISQSLLVEYPGRLSVVIENDVVSFFHNGQPLQP